MFDIGVSKLAIIGGIALIVIGPERLPGVARTVGALLGRARRYVADVQSEVNRSMELDELRKVRESMESAARAAENTLRTSASDFSQALAPDAVSAAPDPVYPEYRRPNKKWRLKQSRIPQWYKARNGLRDKAQSGAARVARFRPRRPS